MFQNEVTGLAAIHQFGNDFAVRFQRHVSLRYDVAIFFPRGKIEAMRFVSNAFAFQFVVDAFDLVALDSIANFEFAIAGVQNLHVVQNAPAFYLAVGRFDKSEFIDARVAGKRADQSDVRTFRRFNRANTSVVRWVNVAYFKARALARKSAWTQRRKTPLVGNF